MSLTPSERSLRARLAAHTLHAKVDSRAHTAPGRQAFLARFDKEVNPTGNLSQEERARRAEQAKKAYFVGLALRSAIARRQKADGSA